MPEIVTLGFVGTGGIAQHHLGKLAELEGVRIGAVCDVVEERARSTAERFGGAPYADYARMLEQERLDAPAGRVAQEYERGGGDGNDRRRFDGHGVVCHDGRRRRHPISEEAARS